MKNTSCSVKKQPTSYWHDIAIIALPDKILYIPFRGVMYMADALSFFRRRFIDDYELEDDSILSFLSEGKMAVPADFCYPDWWQGKLGQYEAE